MVVSRRIGTEQNGDGGMSEVGVYPEVRDLLSSLEPADTPNLDSYDLHQLKRWHRFKETHWW